MDQLLGRRFRHDTLLPITRTEQMRHSLYATACSWNRVGKGFDAELAIVG